MMDEATNHHFRRWARHVFIASTASTIRTFRANGRAGLPRRQPWSSPLLPIGSQRSVILSVRV